VSKAPKESARSEDVVIARIAKARGIRGEVSCIVETDFPERFASLGTAKLRLPDGSSLKLDIEDHWFHQGRVILKFEGYDTMSAAEELVGGQVVIADDDLKPVEEGEFFERQLIGAEVMSGDGRKLGFVSRFLRTGGTDLLVMESEDGREHLIPFAEDICPEIDVAAKRITISPPEGLLEL
jgi:16S rRNA processing protein RimM